MKTKKLYECELCHTNYEDKVGRRKVLYNEI